MSGFLYRYRSNDEVERHVNPGNIRDFTDDPLPGFQGPKFGLPRAEAPEGAGFNLDADDIGEPSDPDDRDEFDPMMEEDEEPTQGQVPPPDTGMRSDGLRDALMELHDRGKIDLFSHMADYLAGVDENEAGEHADVHAMAHSLARRRGYI